MLETEPNNNVIGLSFLKRGYAGTRIFDKKRLRPVLQEIKNKNVCWLNVKFLLFHDKVCIFAIGVAVPDV